jgi:hypothetical protein
MSMPMLPSLPVFLILVQRHVCRLKQIDVKKLHFNNLHKAVTEIIVKQKMCTTNGQLAIRQIIFL